jgi:hypothetical protein
MRCDICGSRKDVRKWWGMLKGRYYTECRQCFLKAVKLYNPNSTQEAIEAEWARGSE